MNQTNKLKTVVSVLGSEIYYLTYDGSKLIRIEKDTTTNQPTTQRG
jgi:hypothetical protein